MRIKTECKLRLFSLWKFLKVHEYFVVPFIAANYLTGATINND